MEAFDKTLIVRFNRPEIRNPLSTEIVESLSKLLDSHELRSVTRVIFIGSGDAFASGANLREIEDLSSQDAIEFAMLGQSLMNKVSRLPVQTVAAINGYCFGGGLDLALACQKRIASPQATFCHPGVNLGIITGWGGTQRLPRLIGEGRALEMLLTAARLNANEARKIGLVDLIANDVLASALNWPSTVCNLKAEA